MEKDTIYDEGKLRISYLHSPERGKEKEVISGEDHELWIKDRRNEWSRYVLPRGILKELAFISKENTSGLYSKLSIINDEILECMRTEKITLEDMKKALMSAYQKEEDNFEKYLDEQKV